MQFSANDLSTTFFPVEIELGEANLDEHVLVLEGSDLWLVLE